MKSETTRDFIIQRADSTYFPKNFRTNFGNRLNHLNARSFNTRKEAEESRYKGVLVKRTCILEFEDSLKDKGRGKERCGRCNGRGIITKTYDDYGMMDPKDLPCSLCNGTGSVMIIP